MQLSLGTIAGQACGVQEIKHDGYRLLVHRDGSCVRCFTRNGHDWADRFPAKARSFLIDGEAVIARDDGTPDFHALRRKRRGHEAVLFAFDLLEHDGDDLRDLPLIERKRRLAKQLGSAKGDLRPLKSDRRRIRKCCRCCLSCSPAPLA